MVALHEKWTGAAITEYDFIESLSGVGDFSDHEQLLSRAWMLGALAQSPSLLARRLNEDLIACLDGTLTRSFNPNSIILKHTQDYTLRANIWQPLAADARIAKLQAGAFSYYAPHDHNYHFTTVGYAGPGYESALFRAGDRGPRPRVGEPATMSSVGTVKLGLGDLMTYEAFKDIHEQRPPSLTSISLNIVFHPASFSASDQLFFDTESGTVSSLVGGGFEALATYIKTAQHIGDQNTVEPLLKLARTHHSQAVRNAALDQIWFLAPFQAAQLGVESTPMARL